jgi:hypothetical protein
MVVPSRVTQLARRVYAAVRGLPVVESDWPTLVEYALGLLLVGMMALIVIQMLEHHGTSIWGR